MLQRDTNFPKFRLHSNPKINRILSRLARATNYGRDGAAVSSLILAPFRRVCDANFAIIDTVLETEGASVFLDASKIPTDLRYLEASGLFDLTLIRLSRDGRGRFHSLVSDVPPRSNEEAAMNVKRWNDRIARLLSEWKRPVIRVQYEEFCNSPLNELRRIAIEADLDPDGMSLEFSGSCSHGIGNGGVAKTRPTRIINKELWKTELSTEQLEIFDRIAGESNRAQGYTD